MKKGLLITSALVLITGVGVALYEKYGKKAIIKPTTDNDINDDANYKQLIKNLGTVKPDINGVLSVTFNSGKNKAQFYPNNRVIIFEGTKRISAGTYSDGGSTIKMDDGKLINLKSVWANLLNTI